MGDVLIYSPNVGTHQLHLRIVLETLGQHQLYAKFSKCEFLLSEVMFLGHIILGERFWLQLQYQQGVSGTYHEEYWMHRFADLLEKTPNHGRMFLMVGILEHRPDGTSLKEQVSGRVRDSVC